MRTRLLPALVAGIALLASACSGGGDGDDPGADNGDTSPGTAAQAGPTYTQFADFPGKSFVTTEPGLDLGIQVKAIDAVWTPELAGVPAEAGKHYVAIYVAVTGELADRGVR